MSAPKKTILGSWGRSHQSVLVALVLAVGLACSPSDDPGDQGRPQVADGAGRSPDSAARVGDGRPRPGPGYAWVIFGADTVVAEVAATAAERERGLMYREAVPDGTGMLFVFEDNRERAFWMANTYVPLDVAYMDPGYRIVDIVPMEPMVTETYPSSAPAMFALEVRQGWFEEQGIREGAQAQVVFGPGGPR